MSRQYSLASLFVVLTAVGVGLGVYLQIAAAAPTLGLSANDWLAIGLAAAIGFLLVAGIAIRRG